MPLPAHSTSADHPVVPCNAQFRSPRSPLDSARGTGAGSACPGDCAPRGNAWMYGPNQSPVDAGKKSVSWKLSGADSGRITDHPQRKYSIENSERALKCSAGFPEVDGKGAGDHARKSKKNCVFCANATGDVFCTSDSPVTEQSVCEPF